MECEVLCDLIPGVCHPLLEIMILPKFTKSHPKPDCFHSIARLAPGFVDLLEVFALCCSVGFSMKILSG